MDKIDRLTLDGREYAFAPSGLFYAGDSWDRYQEPAIYASADGSITFNCSADDIKIGDTVLSNAINGGVTAINSDKIASLESTINYTDTDIDSLYSKVKELDEKIDTVLSLVDNKVSGPAEVGKAFAALADKMKQAQKRDKGKRTLEDLIEPGEPEWISKMNLKTRKVREFRKAQLLTI